MQTESVSADAAPEFAEITQPYQLFEYDFSTVPTVVCSTGSRYNASVRGALQNEFPELTKYQPGERENNFFKVAKWFGLSHIFLNRACREPALLPSSSEYSPCIMILKVSRRNVSS